MSKTIRAGPLLGPPLEPIWLLFYGAGRQRGADRNFRPADKASSFCLLLLAQKQLARAELGRCLAGCEQKPTIERQVRGHRRPPMNERRPLNLASAIPWRRPAKLTCQMLAVGAQLANERKSREIFAQKRARHSIESHSIGYSRRWPQQVAADTQNGLGPRRPGPGAHPVGVAPLAGRAPTLVSSTDLAQHADARPNAALYIPPSNRPPGIDARINYVTNGNINTYPFGFTIPLGYNQSDIIFTWQNLGPTSVSILAAANGPAGQRASSGTTMKRQQQQQ